MTMMMIMLFLVGETIRPRGRCSRPSGHPLSVQVEVLSSLFIIIIISQGTGQIITILNHYSQLQSWLVVIHHHFHCHLYHHIHRASPIDYHHYNRLYSGRTACPTWAWQTRQTLAVDSSTMSIFTTIRQFTNWIIL